MSEKITITRVFDAPREKVWQAWTEPELIKQWWGPEGFSAPSIKIDLKVGGKYVYAMRGPEGSEWDKDMYSAGIFKEIVPMEKIVATDYFSDSEGNKIDPTEVGMAADVPSEMPVMTILFEEIADNQTKLSIVYDKPATEAEFQAMLKSGMKEGWQSSLNKLAEALK
ncbi:MAG TPA: SRPBCC domain-containing protein [Patescibacteria group bacterium]